MAIVDKIRPETIEKLRGTVDFYLLRGILPVARSWPKKPKPPYTELQAEAMAVFAIANRSLRRISDNILKEWRSGSVGKKQAWTDTFRGLIMNFWKINRGIPMITLDYRLIETSTEFRVEWDILQLYVAPIIEEEKYTMETSLILKSDMEKIQEPIYFTLRDSTGTRQVAPFILLDVS